MVRLVIAVNDAWVISVVINNKGTTAQETTRGKLVICIVASLGNYICPVC